MIPIADEIPSRRVPVVTWGLIAANAVIFLYELLLGPQVDQMYMTWGVIPAHITDPLNHPLAFLTLFTSMFIHGGWTHLIGNMLYLWIFGDNVEDVLGRVGYTLFYLAAGVVAGLAQVVVAPSSIIPGIGASGAIAGVLAVYMILFPTAPVRVLVPGYLMMRIARVPSLIVLGFWFIIQLFNGFLSLGTMSVATGGVAWFAHIGGFVAGLVVGFLVRIRIGRRGIW
ncbi:MAG TPA: rhomboid family intramembrane serine protease [Anaerolineales bacterium]|nr:rhomboid family intramembrane serine protease [Anaerolineae bacterium]HIQ02700.1 rhomboid family intramembrane serine protease [Anaerolineales bacterium]